MFKRVYWSCCAFHPTINRGHQEESIHNLHVSIASIVYRSLSCPLSAHSYRLAFIIHGAHHLQKYIMPWESYAGSCWSNLAKTNNDSVMRPNERTVLVVHFTQQSIGAVKRKVSIIHMYPLHPLYAEIYLAHCLCIHITLHSSPMVPIAYKNISHHGDPMWILFRVTLLKASVIM